MRTVVRLSVWRTAAVVLAMGATAGVAQAQYENPTTPGAIPNPGSYQGSLALQQQEQQQYQAQAQQNEAMQQRLNSTYSAYAPGRGGGARRGPPPPNLWDKPPLPPAKNPLLGRWRQGAHRDVAVLTRDPGALPAMFMGFAGHDHAVVAMLNCTLERVGAQRAALTAPPAPAALASPAGPATAAAGSLFDVSVGVGGTPMTNAR